MENHQKFCLGRKIAEIEPKKLFSSLSVAYEEPDTSAYEEPDTWLRRRA